MISINDLKEKLNEMSTRQWHVPALDLLFVVGPPAYGYFKAGKPLKGNAPFYFLFLFTFFFIFYFLFQTDVKCIEAMCLCRRSTPN